MEPVVKTEGLTKHYGKVVGVENLDLTVEEGEIFGFLGPNGAGKTTTLRLLMGMLRPTAGKAEVLGLDAWRQSVAVNAKVGYLPGDAALYDRLTGERHIEYIADFNGSGRELGMTLAERLELDVSRKVEGYSRGMKQKLALILALMKKPPLVILDEPSNGLDPLTQIELYEILGEFRRDGVTVLFSSHNLPEVERVSGRVGIIRKGTLVGTERIEDLRSKRLKNVEIIFPESVPELVRNIEGVSEVEVSGRRVQLKLKGDINPLIALLSGYRVTDFSVTHASLEDVFLEFYGRQERGAEPSEGGEAV
ncbi:MAG: ABC transporter ATP-binding protein [Actinobacteria bacterium]|nr:ABC transporter ATP-binding protein [Actinomycetota bacterium]MBU1943164.1 ABC transporter ATP-binding protein [Actinomycetota bacterium]MBU2687890.1 ABC transporter ATP-binding protein [Actinomycetota bacterium]